RVSSADQKATRQLEALGAVDETFSDQATGSTRKRPQLEALMRHVRRGDTVRVKSPDRLARSTVDLLALLEELEGRGVAVEFMDAPQLNTASAQGRFVLTILGAVAELERAIIRERQAEGIALAKAAGKYDRGPKLDAEQIEQARVRIDSGVSKAQTARDLGVSRQTLYDALAGRAKYAG
ncbi:recombinase family protein, partial [Thiopseudomonas sp. 4R-3cl]